MEGAPSTIIEVIRQQVEELSQVVLTDWFAIDSLRNVVIDLQERFDTIVQHTVGSSIPPSSDLSLKISGRQMYEMRSSQGYTCSKEQEIVRNGIERLEKQVLQYIDIYISCDQVNIALIKKCKTNDVLTVNSMIVNIQKALQKYVGFSGMDPEHCDRIGERMDRAPGLDIEELYIKAEVYSINTSKGYAADVGIFSDNSQVTVFEFLELAELAYLGWGSSIQKANRLYNKHLSDKIKSHLINIFDN